MKNYLKDKKIQFTGSMRNRVFRLCVGLICSMSLALSACEQTERTEETAQRYIAVICKGSQHEFWKTVEQGALDAGEELGVRVSFIAPEDESQIDVQIGMMEDAIADGADAIVLGPLDTERLNDVIDKAVGKGIPVITLDSDVTTDKREATIGTNNINAGAIAARNAAEMMGGKGQVAIIGHEEGAQTAIERYQGFADTIEENYKDITVVGVEYCGGSSDVAKQQTEQFLKDYPDIKCFYGLNEGSAVGIAAAIDEMGLKDSIPVIGFDSSDDEIEYLKKGVIDGMMVQNPYNMGYIGVRNINKVLDGRKIEEKIETGATYVNADNLQDEDTEWLLYPLGK